MISSIDESKISIQHVPEFISSHGSIIGVEQQKQDQDKEEGKDKDQFELKSYCKKVLGSSTKRY